MNDGPNGIKGGRVAKKSRGGITFPEGFLASGLFSGIKKAGKADLALLASETECLAAGLFTTNRIKAAPVVLSQRRIRSGSANAIVINSGNANACTGESGMQDALRITEKVSQFLTCNSRKVLCASTGVIGRPLPIESVLDAIPKLVEKLSPNHHLECARAIMTTDTYPKEAQGFIPSEISGKCVSRVNPRPAPVTPDLPSTKIRPPPRNPFLAKGSIPKRLPVG